MDNADFKVTEPKAEVIRHLPDDKKITGLVVLALERIALALCALGAAYLTYLAAQYGVNRYMEAAKQAKANPAPTLTTPRS
jgi:hypothetical protein